MTTATATSSTSQALDVGVQHVRRTFGAPRLGAATDVLDDVNLSIAAGEIAALIGASGSGKSTLLRLVAGLDSPTSGTVTIGGATVSGIDPRCAVGFQEPRLMPWRTIAQNVALGLPRGTDRTAGSRRVDELLDLVGLGSCHDHRPREVSGGMAQRASLARALARNPGVLLLDEPFGALDALTRLQMQDLLLDIHREQPTTVLLVTHDVDEALYLADHIFLLGSDSPGRAAHVQSSVPIPGARPRDRNDPQIRALHASLLAGLGVPRSAIAS